MQKAEENAAISDDVNTDTMEPLENINHIARTTPGKDAGSEKQPVLKNKIHIKKSITDYLFDFIMLFLAVTAGFFVENVRENYAERSREKQYIASLIRDLAADTLSMSAIIESTKKQANGIDTLLTILDKPKSNFFVSDVYYYSFRYMFNATFFSHTDGTITQLKNAGGLRLIRQGVADSIIEYYSLADNVKWNTDFGLAQFNKVLELEKSLFDFKTLRINRFSQVLTPHQKSALSFMTSEPLILNRFYAETFFLLAQLNNCNRLLMQLKPRAGF